MHMHMRGVLLCSCTSPHQLSSVKASPPPATPLEPCPPPCPNHPPPSGIDTREWNPATDVHLPAKFSAADLRGKRRCKEELQAELRLPPEPKVRAPRAPCLDGVGWGGVGW